MEPTPPRQTIQSNFWSCCVMALSITNFVKRGINSEKPTIAVIHNTVLTIWGQYGKTPFKNRFPTAFG
ncbi:MAG: hypothetical protein OXU51_21545, partial [Candidatus Poribacteria bacterium]|nr:hypothetical protein [Candidatus Poribacteria bacterium]